MSNIKQIEAFIATCSKEELSQFWEIGKQRQRVLREQELAALVTHFTEDQLVTFDRGPSKGGVCTGTVVKVNPKKIKVRVDTLYNGGIWNVPKQLLAVANDV